MGGNLKNNLPIVENPWIEDDAVYIFNDHKGGGSNFLVCSPQVAKIINVGRHKSVEDVLKKINERFNRR